MCQLVVLRELFSDGERILLPLIQTLAYQVRTYHLGLGLYRRVGAHEIF